MQRRGTFRAFTLAELLCALAVMSVLMLALSSTVMIAARALPSESHPVTRLTRGSSVLQGLADDLAEAVAITERGDHAIAFIVADRDGDGAPERIRYAWAGNSGDALTRSYNGSAAAVAADVQVFDVAYTLRTTTATYSGAIRESAEQLWSSFDDSSDFQDFTIKKQEWIGQLIDPKLPVEAVAWRVTRAKLGLRYKGSTDGQIDVQLRPVDDAGLPAAKVLDYARIAESALPSKYAWVDVNFSAWELMAAGAPACLAVVASNNQDDSAQVLHNDKTGTGYFETRGAETKWASKSNRGVFHYVHGSYFYPGPDQTVARRFVTAVDLDLRTGTDASGAVHTAVRTVNEPEVLRAFWTIDAGENPAFDRNGDGLADFDTTTALVMNPDLMMDTKIGSSWTVPVVGTVLTSAPNHDFADQTTLELQFRDTNATDKQSAMVCLNLDWSGTTNAQIYAAITLEPDATQTLIVSGSSAARGATQWVKVMDLPTDLVALRLLADPARDSVNVRVNGEDRGTYTYGVTNRLTATEYLQLAPWASADAEFARVRVRVEDTTP